jgi:hypothetical protein
MHSLVNTEIRKHFPGFQPLVRYCTACRLERIYIQFNYQENIMNTSGCERISGLGKVAAGKGFPPDENHLVRPLVKQPYFETDIYGMHIGQSIALIVS